MPRKNATVTAAVRKLKKLTEQVGKDRDALRELNDEIEALLGSCDEAIEGLERAIDALSQYA